MVKDLLRIGMSVMIGLSLALPFAAVHAADANGDGFDDVTGASVSGGSNAIDDVSDLLPSSFADETGLGQKDLKAGLGELINVALGFLGIVAVIIILFGGFKWMTAGGNDEKVGEAKRLIIAGIIGLAIILSAYAITTFVLQSLIDATT
ncbi:MAG: hypothetical protein AAB776_03395 [Patescibacteria group bacterium]